MPTSWINIFRLKISSQRAYLFYSSILLILYNPVDVYCEPL